MMEELKQSVKNLDRGMSRRTFLQGAGAAAAAFTVVPRHVIGAGEVPPSEKLNIACIGVGGRGASDVDGVKSENIIGLCDVDWRQADGTFKKFPKAKRYKDFRKMLDELEKDIDAVTVATPDHCHAIASMNAIKRGKHCYCEKPLTHTVSEARALREAAQKYGVQTQMGNQGQATEGPRRLKEFIDDGAIGNVHEVHIWTDRPLGWWPQGVERPTNEEPVPGGVDWDLWLGPAPVRPYNSAYLPFKWRGWWDFGTGSLGDMGCHGFDPIFRALDLSYPTKVHATSTKLYKESAPLACIVTYDFPARGEKPPVRLTWYDGGLKAPRPMGLEDNRSLGSNGTYYVGDKGIILDGRIIPEEKMRQYKQPAKTLPRSVGHHLEWIEACKDSSKRKPGSNFDFASVVTETVLLGNIAIRTGKVIEYDGKAGKITNNADANALIQHEYRNGWSL